MLETQFVFSKILRKIKYFFFYFLNSLLQFYIFWWSTFALGPNISSYATAPNIGFKFNWSGHHTTFTLVSPLFEIIIYIFFIQVTSIWVSPSRIEKFGKNKKLQNTKNLQVNIYLRFFFFAKILWYLFYSLGSLSFKSQCSATYQRRDMNY